MRASTSWWLLSALALTLSCERSRRAQQGFLAECSFNDECNAPLICAARRCRVECRSDRDCTNQWRCLSAGQPARYVCYAPDDYHSACVYSADCRASWVCADRECRPQCRASYDCALISPGTTCLRDLGVCSAHPGLTDAGTLPDVDLNDPDGAIAPPLPDVLIGVDTLVTDVADAAAPPPDLPPPPDVPVDAGDPFACATRTGGGACAPGAGCGVAAVGIGFDARCAVLSDGSARCWGNNASGVLGNGTTTSCGVPSLVPGLVDAREVGLGLTFACARRAAGAGVQCWGRSYVGELGNGTAMGAFALTPTSNSAMDGALSVGNAFACTLASGGAASCWGDNSAGQYGDGSTGGPGFLTYWATPRTVSLPARALSLGVAHACAVGLDGAARCWGANGMGALGDGTLTDHPTPTPVPGLTAVEEVLAAQNHSCARLADGTVRCWGGNVAGQLGDGTRSGRSSPVAPAVTGVVELAINGFATCARHADGGVSCWGDREFVGLDGAAAMSPTRVAGLAGVTRLYGGAAGFCVLRGADAALWCWGRASGNAAAGLATAYRPVEVSW